VVCSRPIGDGYIFQTLKPKPTAVTEFHNVSTPSDADAQTTASQRSFVFVCKFMAHVYLFDTVGWVSRRASASTCERVVKEFRREVTSQMGGFFAEGVGRGVDVTPASLD